MNSIDLIQGWDRFEGRLREASRLCVLCDYDGTLAPIEARPGLVELPSGTLEALEALAARQDTVLGVISGRALSDLRHRILIRRAWLVGNHGAELRTPQGEERRLYDDDDERRVLAARDRLASILAGTPGLILEPKGPVVAVHYRAVGAGRVRAVQDAVLQVLREDPRGLTLSPGDRVLELRARPDRGKGNAVRLIRRTLPPGSAIVYFGDDRSDVEAFQELAEGGVRIAVRGLLTRHADYTLDDARAVAEALSRLARREAGGTRNPWLRRSRS